MGSANEDGAFVKVATFILPTHRCCRPVEYTNCFVFGTLRSAS